MSTNHRPSLWLTVPIFFGLFFGGGYVGSVVSRIVAPDSDLAEFVSFLALPAAFVIGIVAWAGAAIPVAIREILLRSARSAREAKPKAANPPGSFAFVPAALVSGVAAGAVVGALSTELGFGWVLCLYAGLGLGYGVACWRLARTGYLQFPTE